MVKSYILKKKLEEFFFMKKQKNLPKFTKKCKKNEKNGLFEFYHNLRKKW